MIEQLRDTYKSQFTVSLNENFQYRVQMLMQMIRIMIEPVILLVVWQVTARSSGGEVAGYSANDFALYFIMWAFVRTWTLAWHPGMFEGRIRRGEFNMLLMRPIHPIHPDMAYMLASKFIEMLVLLPTLGVLWLIFQPQWQPVWWAVAAFWPAVILGYLLRFMAMYALALVAFWTTRLDALFNAWTLTEYVVSGRFAPLGVLPPWLRLIADILPFQWMFGFPLELILGNLTPRQTLIGFGLQIGWLIVAIVVFRVLWKAGVKRYSAVGG